MHTVFKLIEHTKEGYLNTSPFRYYLTCDVDKKVDYSGTHFTCIISRKDDPSTETKEVIKEKHTYTDTGEDKERQDKLLTEVYFKLMNLMLEGL